MNSQTDHALLYMIEVIRNIISTHEILESRFDISFCLSRKSFLCLNHIKITNYYQNPLAVCIANQLYFNKTNCLAVWLKLFQLFFFLMNDLLIKALFSNQVSYVSNVSNGCRAYSIDWVSLIV